MNRYTKGARGERELIGILKENRYSVMRSAGSGVNSISPDVIAFRDGKGFAFECKAWNTGSVSIKKEKIDLLRFWEANTGMTTLIAWRIPGGNWLFIKPSEMKAALTNYRISMKEASSINRGILFFTQG